MSWVAERPDWLPGTQGHAHSRLQALLAGVEELQLQSKLRALAETALPCLPEIGLGDSATRLRAFAEIAAADLSLARLAEGHADALSILSQAGEVPSDGLYGVWVAGEPPDLEADGTELSGQRPYCSGVGIVERALVTGGTQAAVILTEIDATGPKVVAIPGTWPAVGMSATASHTVRFENCPTLRHIGPADFYRDRRGFWLGSLNVAACWYGGALGLARTYLSCTPESALDASTFAEIDTALRTMVLHLNAAAAESDSGTPETSAELPALRCRRAVYEGCNAVLRLVSEAGGTHLATHHAMQAQRLADLPIYLRQHHPGRERQRLGEVLLKIRGDSS